MAPAGEDIGRDFMSLLGADVLGDRMGGGQPGRGGNFTDVIVFFRPQEGAQLHRELIFAAVMAGDRLYADLKRNSFDFKGADDLGGIEQGVNHVGRFGSHAGVSLPCLR